jgi:hypothetical protein
VNPLVDGPVPIAFVAVTVNEYEVPRVSPTMLVEVTAGDPVTANPVHPEQLGVGVTVYWVMVAPLLAGAVQVRLTVSMPLAVPASPVGAPGTDMSITGGEEAGEEGPVPIALVAVTVKVYAVPRVSPVISVQSTLGVRLPQPEHAGFGVTV